MKDTLVILSPAALFGGAKDLARSFAVPPWEPSGLLRMTETEVRND